MVHPASWAPLTAFAAALLAVWWLARGRFSNRILDLPTVHSLHETPVPRTGGLGLHAGVLLAIGIISPALPVVLWIACGGLMLVSFVDDVRGLPATWRLATHLAASWAFATVVLAPDTGLPLIAAVTLALAWMANLYNFMDGSDGFAGGMALIGFACYGAAAWLAGNTGFALVNLSIAAAAAAFLVFNFSPARIFLGDAGSVTLGFLAGALGLIGWRQGDWAAWFAPLVFSPFIVDASVTLARRCLRGDKIWHGHREHYYQRLVRMGWGHRRTALAGYALMLAGALAALAALAQPPQVQAAMLAGAAIAHLVLMALIDRRWRRHVAAGGA